MTVYDDYFDEIFLLDATFRLPVTVGEDLEIETSEIPILEGHPLFPELAPHPTMKNMRIVSSGTLIFKGCIYSERSASPYIGDPKNPQGYSPTEIVIDVPRRPVPDGCEPQKYFFQGVCAPPPAFVDSWEILAMGFALRINQV